MKIGYEDVPSPSIWDYPQYQWSMNKLFDAVEKRYIMTLLLLQKRKIIPDLPFDLTLMIIKYIWANPQGFFHGVGSINFQCMYSQCYFYESLTDLSLWMQK